MPPPAPELNAAFAALADPIRRGVLARLARGPCSVSELGAPHRVSAPAITKHLDVLARAGLITRWKMGRTHFCRLQPAPLEQAVAWIEQQRIFWERQFDQLDEFLRGEDGTWTSPALINPPGKPSASGGASPPAPKGSSPLGRARKR